MTEIDGVTAYDVINKWKRFKDTRNKNINLPHSHDDFITVLNREVLIDDLINHYHFLESEYAKLEKKYMEKINE